MLEIPVLSLPGIDGSGPDHWQTLWEARDPAIRRVPQRDWQNPDRSEWSASLEREARARGGLESEIAVVAHSLGCLVLAHWATITECRVRGALAVAPPDPYGASFPAAARGFTRLPTEPWPFPSVVAASADDPYGDPAFARACARSWGGELVEVGALGHINAESGLGDWPAGFALLRRVVEDPVVETIES